MATSWTLARIISKVQDDLDLHEENFVTTEDLKQFVNDSIDDAEETIIDCFSDFFLTFVDLPVEEDETVIDLPEDIYESRMRGLYFSETGFTSLNPSGEGYKVKRVSLERVMDVNSNERYQYRLFNSESLGQKLYIYPPIRATSTIQFRLWYIRQAKRLEDDTDVLEKGLRIQYVLAHVKKSVMEKMGDPMLEVQKMKLDKQEDKLKNSLSRLTDDDEDVYLEPDARSLEDAYGFGDY